LCFDCTFSRRIWYDLCSTCFIPFKSQSWNNTITLCNLGSGHSLTPSSFVLLFFVHFPILSGVLSLHIFLFFWLYNYLIQKKWAIAQENEPRWSKHVLRQFHLIRKTIEMKNIKIVRVNIEENLIYPVTKTLSSI
jgi:hypothetical protein